MEQVLRHPYLESMQCDDDEPVSPGISKKAFEFELGFCTPNKLREEIIKEMLFYDNSLDNYDSSCPQARRRGGSVGSSSVGELDSSYISRSLDDSSALASGGVGGGAGAKGRAGPAAGRGQGPTSPRADREVRPEAAAGAAAKAGTRTRVRRPRESSWTAAGERGGGEGS